MAFDLTGKWGPVPKWAAIGGGGLALAGVVWYRKKQAAAAAAAASGTGSTTGVGTADESGDTGPDTSGSYTPPSSSVTLPSGASYTGPPDQLGEVVCTLGGGTWDATTSTCTQPTPSAAPTTTPSTPTAPNAPAQQNLPPVNAASYPAGYNFGSYDIANFTQIGTVNNGTAQGQGVSGGVPVYAAIFGGLYQNFHLNTLPNGTKLYIPNQFNAYIDNSP